MEQKVAILALLPQEINSLFSLPHSYQGKQIFKWLMSGVTSFSLMTNLSKDLQTHLSQKANIRSLTISKRLKDKDGSQKLQITLFDGLAIEAVLLKDNKARMTACVSSQVGCAMGCGFCKTGTLRLARNLTAAEIVEEFLLLEEISLKIDNLVFMGMGEPFANLDNVFKAISIITNKEGRNFSPKRITISTCGITQGIKALADTFPQVRLAVSLTSADTQLRTQLMPITKTQDLLELKSSILYYTKKTGQRVTLEAVLLHDINTDEKAAKQLQEFCKGFLPYINLIPWNTVKNLPYTAPSKKESYAFLNMLTKMGFNATIRTRRGKNISGACGQLGIADKEKE